MTWQKLPRSKPFGKACQSPSNYTSQGPWLATFANAIEANEDLAAVVHKAHDDLHPLRARALFERIPDEDCDRRMAHGERRRPPFRSVGRPSVVSGERLRLRCLGTTPPSTAEGVRMAAADFSVPPPFGGGWN